MHCNLKAARCRPVVLGCFWPNLYSAWAAHKLLFQSFDTNSGTTIGFGDPTFLWYEYFGYRRTFTTWPWPLILWSWTYEMYRLSRNQTLCHIWEKSINPRLSYWWLNDLYPPALLGAVLSGLDLRVVIWEDHRSNLDHLPVYFRYLIYCFVSKLEGLKDQILHLLTPPVKN